MKLTKKEQAWIDEVNAVLARCPSERLGFATIGDPSITIYDRRKDAAIDKLLDRGNMDFVPAAQHLGHLANETLEFPAGVLSTAG